jgi:alpha-ketoglutarate-dependent taurine dioxygenase
MEGTEMIDIHLPDPEREVAVRVELERGAGEAGIPALRAVLAEHGEELERHLLTHGALLFRGFGIDREELFGETVAVLPGRQIDYVDGNSPRRKLRSGIYTSTEYPPEYFISMHNELSYSPHWPARLVFCCVSAPAEGGETPLADSRRILARLDPALVAEWRARGIEYVRNLHGGAGMGPSWKTTFETDDRAAVERFCHESGARFEWRDDGGLRISHVRPAVAVHPRTGEEVWFNQADQFHPSTHPKAVLDAMLALYKGREDRLPQSCRFGDGTPIPVAALEAVRETTREQIRTFPWQAGDLLLVDNMLVSHGRMPFRGPRKILVSMLDS